MKQKIIKKWFCLVLMCLLFVVISALTSAAELPTVVILTTGGTIAMMPDPKTGGLVPAVTGDDLVKSVAGLKEIANIKVIEFSNISSAVITPEHWVKLSKTVDNILADPEVVGVVIPHGTCTIEDTAYFLDLTVKSDKPVIFTGAMLSPSYQGSDGPRNILNAVKVAILKEAKGKGTFLILNNYINAAREATKTHQTNFQTFESGPSGYLGYVDVERVYFYRESLRRQKLPISDKLPRIDMIYMYPGADGSHLRYAVDSGAEGIILTGVCGVVNCEMADAAKYAIQKGVTVVLSSRVFYGRQVTTYGGCGGTATMKNFGCIMGNDLTPWKARILLMLALPITKDQKKLQEYFDK